MYEHKDLKCYPTIYFIFIVLVHAVALLYDIFSVYFHLNSTPLKTFCYVGPHPTLCPTLSLIESLLELLYNLSTGWEASVIWLTLLVEHNMLKLTH